MDEPSLFVVVRYLWHGSCLFSKPTICKSFGVPQGSYLCPFLCCQMIVSLEEAGLTNLIQCIQSLLLSTWIKDNKVNNKKIILFISDHLISSTFFLLMEKLWFNNIKQNLAIRFQEIYKSLRWISNFFLWNHYLKLTFFFWNGEFLSHLLCDGDVVVHAQVQRLQHKHS